MTAAGSVTEAVESALHADPSTGPLVVALSGGLDSCVLLHVLRFRVHAPREIVAAHFDHRMRPSSAADAAWVRGLCRAWCVELVEGNAGRLDGDADGVVGGGTRPDDRAVSEGSAGPVAPAVSEPSARSEDDARRARYAFFRTVMERRGGTLLTAHHADDQAETVLFRALRGSGVEGLAGIPRSRRLDGGDARSPLVLRPLLDVWREELEGYARAEGLGWRDDPTNDAVDYARNVLRNEILPAVEAKVAPGARRSLARLGVIAAGEEAAWAVAMEHVLPSIDARGLSRAEARGRPGAGTTGGADAPPSCSRARLLALGPALASRVIRVMADHVGHTLDHDATRRALDFVTRSQSGRGIELGRGVELRLAADRVVVTRPTDGGGASNGGDDRG